MRSGSRKTTRDPSNRRQAKARGTSAPLGLPWVPSARPLATAVEYALSSPVESAALLYASPLPPPPQRLVPGGRAGSRGGSTLYQYHPACRPAFGASRGMCCLRARRVSPSSLVKGRRTRADGTGRDRTRTGTRRVRVLSPAECLLSAHCSAGAPAPLSACTPDGRGAASSGLPPRLARGQSPPAASTPIAGPHGVARRYCLPCPRTRSRKWPRLPQPTRPCMHCMGIYASDPYAVESASLRCVECSYS